MARKAKKEEVLLPSGRSCYYVPEDGSTHVPGRGYRVSVVIEGESGHFPTGDCDYASRPGARQPYFYGPPDQNPTREGLQLARETCADVNARNGLLVKDCFDIVTSSMSAQNREDRENRLKRKARRGPRRS